MTSDPQTALIAAELRDGYERACRNNELNRNARARLSYTLWPDQSLADLCLEILDRDKSEPRQLRVIIMHPTADGGMPHTRAGNIICIPANYPHTKLVNTLKHEKCHVNQRLFPELWKRNLQVDGWTEYPTMMLPEHLVKRCRLNPDTIQKPFWAWKHRWIPMPLFQREDAPNLREVSVRWWDIETNTLLNNVPQSCLEKYGMLPPPAWEHPYEIYGYLSEFKKLQ